MYSALLTGFMASSALIVAIGAQNAFVLRQGLRREHVLPIVLLCAGADALLIAAGIAGLGALIQATPLLLRVTWLGGGLFLLAYGLVAGRRALHPKQLLPGTDAGLTLKAALLACLAFTFLNPHVYLDTVLLLGSLAGQREAAERWPFGAGAMLASFTWFLLLGYGARLAAPAFRKTSTWRLVDCLVAVTMLGLGGKLLLRT